MEIGYFCWSRDEERSAGAFSAIVLILSLFPGGSCGEVVNRTQRDGMARARLEWWEGKKARATNGKGEVKIGLVGR